MKQIDDIPPSNHNRFFETPQKKERQLNKSSDAKPQQLLHLDNSDEKFDLSESPKFKVSTNININQKSFLKPGPFESMKKQYLSPVLVKFEERQSSTFHRFKTQKHQRSFLNSYGDMKRKQNFSKCYADLLKQITNTKKHVEIPEPEILHTEIEDENIYSQLVTFSLNIRNSRKLVYDEEKMTMIPHYECLGCGRIYDNQSALGGHVRSCPQKQVHYNKLNNYFKSCVYLNQCSSESFQEQKPVKRNRNEDILKTPQRNPVMEELKVYKRTEKHKQSHSIYFSSQESPIPKSIQGSEKQMFEIYHLSASQAQEAQESERMFEVEKTVKKIKKQGGRKVLSRPKIRRQQVRRKQRIYYS